MAINRVRKPLTGSTLDLKLPEKKTGGVVDFSTLTFLIYGEKKIGKTSFCSHFEDALFLLFEPGAKSLDIYGMDMPSWNHCKKADKLLQDNPDKFKTVIVDTGYIAYDMCQKYILEENGLTDMPEDYGNTWTKIKSEFNTVQNSLARNRGFVAICHDKIAEVTTKSGTKFNICIPDLSKQASGHFAANADIIGHYQFLDGQRWLQIGKDDYTEAGCRCEKNFLTPDGDSIFKIPMGNSSKEAYENFVNAFNNKQQKTYNTNEIKKTKTKIIRKK